MHKSSKDLFKKDPKIAERIDNCVNKLIKVFKPEEIILFGSFGRGEVKEDGTLDFIVIAETKDRFFDRIKKALEACSGASPPIEPLIYTPSEFNQMLVQGEGFLEEALEEGVVLFQEE